MSRDEAKEFYAAAEHIFSVTYPSTADEKLFMVVLQHLLAALTAVQTAIPENNAILNEIKGISRQLEQCHTLFSRRGKLVAANNEYVLLQITAEQIEKYLQQVGQQLQQIEQEIHRKA